MLRCSTLAVLVTLLSLVLASFASAPLDQDCPCAVSTVQWQSGPDDCPCTVMISFMNPTAGECECLSSECTNTMTGRCSATAKVTVTPILPGAQCYAPTPEEMDPTCNSRETNSFTCGSRTYNFELRCAQCSGECGS